MAPGLRSTRGVSRVGQPAGLDQDGDGAKARGTICRAPEASAAPTWEMTPWGRSPLPRGLRLVRPSAGRAAGHGHLPLFYRLIGRSLNYAERPRPARSAGTCPVHAPYALCTSDSVAGANSLGTGLDSTRPVSNGSLIPSWPHCGCEVPPPGGRASGETSWEVHMENATRDVPRQVTIAEAAAVLGVSSQTVRRRIQAGELHAERVRRPQGFAYLVALPDGDLPRNVAALRDVTPVGQLPRDVARDVAARPRHTARRDLPRNVPADPVAVELVVDLREAHARIAHLEQERFELAGRLGYFQSELEHARGQIKALEAPRPPAPEISSAAAAVGEAAPPRRSWWRFW